MTSCPALLTQVVNGLEQLWSPEEISKRLRLEHPDDPMMQVSHEAGSGVVRMRSLDAPGDCFGPPMSRGISYTLCAVGTAPPKSARAEAAFSRPLGTLLERALGVRDGRRRPRESEAHVVRGSVTPYNEVGRSLAQDGQLLGEARVVGAADLELVAGLYGDRRVQVVRLLVVEVVVRHAEHGPGLGRPRVHDHREAASEQVHVGLGPDDVAAPVDGPGARRRVA